jgi:membrane fusion protein (multidrug efflux system)
MLPLGKKGFIAKDTLEKAEAELKKKKAEMEENAVLLQHARLIAPFDGAVGKCKVNEGEFINAAQSIVTITDTKNLRVEYNLPEKSLPSLKIGQDVKISSAAYPGKTFTGKVSFISPTINVENRSIALYAEVINASNELASGMLVNVEQALGINEHALMIPARSLVPVLDGQQVFKVVNGKASATNVVIGKRTENEVQIVSGLSAGDQVITDGQMKVRNTMPVKIKPIKNQADA